MKRFLAIFVTLVLLITSFTTLALAADNDSNTCNCGCPYCCAMRAEIKPKTTSFRGSILLIIDNKGWITGVIDPHEEKIDGFGGFIGFQKSWSSKELAIPKEMVGNGKLKRTKAWATIDISNFIEMALREIDETVKLNVKGMTTFRNAMVSIQPEYYSRVEHAVRSFYYINFGIPYDNVVINSLTISFALLHFYSVSDSVCKASETFFTSVSESEECGVMEFEVGAWLSIKIGDFDGDGIEDIGLAPGAGGGQAKFEPVQETETKTQNEPTPKPQPSGKEKDPQPTKSKKDSTTTVQKTTCTKVSQETTCTKDSKETTVTTNVVNLIIGPNNKVTTVTQNQVDTGCKNNQTVTLPSCK